jgi:hypothetical protein
VFFIVRAVNGLAGLKNGVGTRKRVNNDAAKAFTDKDSSGVGPKIC